MSNQMETQLIFIKNLYANWGHSENYSKYSHIIY